MEETNNISHICVGNVRDALAEVVKRLNRDIIATNVEALCTKDKLLETPPIIVCDAQDEARMKVKAYKDDANADAFRRYRTTV